MPKVYDPSAIEFMFVSIVSRKVYFLDLESPRGTGYVMNEHFRDKTGFLVKFRDFGDKNQEPLDPRA